MIDFKSSSFSKLKKTKIGDHEKLLKAMLVSKEEIIDSYKGIRDSVVFTNKRIIAINSQGVTGKKKDYTSIPYSKIQSFSVESAGTFDLDSEIAIWVSSIGEIKFDFSTSSDINEISKMIAEYTL